VNSWTARFLGDAARKVVSADVAREMMSGFAVAALAIPICAASGVLALGPLGVAYVGLGAVGAILCGAIGGLISALVRSSSFALTTPTTPSALVQASGAAGVVAAAGTTNPELAAVAIPLIVFLAGILQIVFGLLGLGRLVKFVPHPVVSGFVTGIAVLIFLNQFPAALGYQSVPKLLSAMADGNFSRLPLWGYSVMMLGALWLLSWMAPRTPITLLALGFGVGAYHLLRELYPAINLGPTLGRVDVTGLHFGDWLSIINLDALMTNFDALRAVFLCALTLSLVGTLDIVLGLRAAQNLAEIPSSPIRDTVGLGLGNIAAAFAGGVVVSTSVSLLNANYQSGGRSRISTATVAVLLLVLVLILPDATAAIPVCVFPPLLVFLSYRLFDRYTLAVVKDAWRASEPVSLTQARRNALVHFMVLLPTAVSQPAIGVIIGVALSCVVFVIEMSRPVVARAASAKTISSKRARSRTDGAILRQEGERILVLDLQGPMFFGNSEDLAARIKQANDVDYIILNFRRVSYIDASGVNVLQLIAKRCRTGGKRLLAANSPAQLHTAIVGAVGHKAFFSDVDLALEWAENSLLETHDKARQLDGLLGVEALDLMQEVQEEQVRIFASYLETASVPAGSYLCREGDMADRIWFLRNGSVSIRVTTAGAERRIGALGAGTTIGEMGVLEGKPRSASVIADEPAELFVLKIDAWRALLAEHRQLGQMFLVHIARDLSDRLRDRSAELGAALM
jgi:sulfate permease, SulP family